VGSSWADFADQLALSKLGSVRIEGCSLASKTEGASQQPDALVKHIDSLLDDVFQVCLLSQMPFIGVLVTVMLSKLGSLRTESISWLLNRGSLPTARCPCEAH